MRVQVKRSRDAKPVDYNVATHRRGLRRHLEKIPLKRPPYANGVVPNTLLRLHLRNGQDVIVKAHTVRLNDGTTWDIERGFGPTNGKHHGS